MFFPYLLCGLAAGVLGGMGMGGGTLLIPLLTLLLEVEQRTAQGVNLLTFLPMAAAALCMHFKNGLADTRGALRLILPACLMSAAGALLSGLFDGGTLHRIFGGFLILLSGLQLFSVFVFGAGEGEKASPKSAFGREIRDLPAGKKKIRPFREK